MSIYDESQISGQVLISFRRLARRLAVLTVAFGLLIALPLLYAISPPVALGSLGMLTGLLLGPILSMKHARVVAHDKDRRAAVEAALTFIWQNSRDVEIAHLRLAHAAALAGSADVRSIRLRRELERETTLRVALLRYEVEQTLAAKSCNPYERRLGASLYHRAVATSVSTRAAAEASRRVAADRSSGTWATYCVDKLKYYRARLARTMLRTDFVHIAWPIFVANETGTNPQRSF